MISFTKQMIDYEIMFHSQHKSQRCWKIIDSDQPFD